MEIIKAKQPVLGIQSHWLWHSNVDVLVAAAAFSSVVSHAADVPVAAGWLQLLLWPVPNAVIVFPCFNGFTENNAYKQFVDTLMLAGAATPMYIVVWVRKPASEQQQHQKNDSGLFKKGATRTETRT